jgi:hypothetical protein
VAGLTKLLREAQRQAGEPMRDSPVFQLVEGYAPPDISRLKTDVFRDQAEYALAARRKLEAARGAGKAAVQAAATELGDVGRLEAGVVIDLLLSYRAVSDWAAMVALAGAMPAPLARSTMVREQQAFALNRLGRGEEAEALLKALIAERGASSENCGLLGRVYKDRWDKARRQSGNDLQARAWLKSAIEAYLQGFEADWRDAYPGVNAVTLMTLANPPDKRRRDLLPVVTYAVKRRIAKGAADYWDHATLLELAVLAEDEAQAGAATLEALAKVRERWEPETTARNLGLIREARTLRGHDVPWAKAIEDALVARSKQ